MGPGFIFTGLILIGAERIGNGRKDIKEKKLMDSLLIGAGQGLDAWGIRSGMTITTGLALGLERGFAADYAFVKHSGNIGRSISGCFGCGTG